jgi:hypothetical protein
MASTAHRPFRLRLATMGAVVAVLSATSIPSLATQAYGPPYMPEAIRYMQGHGLRRACAEVFVRRGHPSVVEFRRGTGNATLDRAIARGVLREVDQVGRMDFSGLRPGPDGRYLVPLTLTADFGGKAETGCAKPAVADPGPHAGNQGS